MEVVPRRECGGDIMVEKGEEKGSREYTKTREMRRKEGREGGRGREGERKGRRMR